MKIRIGAASDELLNYHAALAMGFKPVVEPGGYQVLPRVFIEVGGIVKTKMRHNPCSNAQQFMEIKQQFSFLRVLESHPATDEMPAVWSCSTTNSAISYFSLRAGRAVAGCLLKLQNGKNGKGLTFLESVEGLE